MKTMEEMKMPCTCGSGKMYGECHGKDETCPCGSGKKVSECHMKSAETPM